MRISGQKIEKVEEKSHITISRQAWVLLNDDGVCWQERAELLLLRYASRWARHFVRRRLDLVIDSQERDRGVMGLSVPPRHCVSARCPCQFIEDHLKHKPKGKLTLRKFFLMPDFTRWLPMETDITFKKGTLEFYNKNPGERNCWCDVSDTSNDLMLYSQVMYYATAHSTIFLNL